MYFKRYTSYRDAKKEWKYYHAIQTIMKEKIKAKVAKQKAAKLSANLPIRTWLQDLKALSIPPETTIEQSIFMKYHCLINIRYTKWPIYRPGAWLAIWKNLIY